MTIYLLCILYLYNVCIRNIGHNINNALCGLGPRFQIDHVFFFFFKNKYDFIGCIGIT